VRDETVFDEGGMTEQISTSPLGVVANISAWNYPWFVGCNVIVPALLTGNAVLYKPSEYAAMTGLEIARLLHEAGVPRRRDGVPGGGAGEVGAALLAQRDRRRVLHRLHATGVKIAQAVGTGWSSCSWNWAARTRPTCAARCRPESRRRVAGRRRHVQHRPELLLGGAHLRAREDARRLREALRRHRAGLQGR
jgi:hypothetical protein